MTHQPKAPSATPHAAEDEGALDGDPTATDVPLAPVRSKEHAAQYAVVRVDGFNPFEDYASQALEVVLEASGLWRSRDISTSQELHRFLSQWRADLAVGRGQEDAATYGRPRTQAQPFTVLGWPRRSLPWARRVKALAGHHVSWVPPSAFAAGTSPSGTALPIYRKAFSAPLPGGAPATLCVLLRPVAPDELPTMPPHVRALLVDGIHRPDPGMLPRLFKELDARLVQLSSAGSMQEAWAVAAGCHWLLVQGQPLQRGNSSVADLWVRTVLEARGFMVPPWAAGVVPGLEALTMEEAAFVAAWPGLLEAQAPEEASQPARPTSPFADHTPTRNPSTSRALAQSAVNTEPGEAVLPEVLVRGPPLGPPPRVGVKDLRRSLEDAQQGLLPLIPLWEPAEAVERGIALLEPFGVRTPGTRRKKPLSKALQQHSVLTPAQGERILWHAGCAISYLKARENAVVDAGTELPPPLRTRQVAWEKLAWRCLGALIPERLAALLDLCVDFPLNREDHERAALMAIYADFGHPFLFPELDPHEECVRVMHVLLARELGLLSASTLARHLRSKPELVPRLLRVVDDVTAFMGWPPDVHARRVVDRILEAQARRQPEVTRVGRSRDSTEREQSRLRALDTLRQRLAHPYKKLIMSAPGPDSTNVSARLTWAHLDRTSEALALGREELVLLADAGLREWRVPNPSDRATRLALAAQVVALFARGPVVPLVAGSQPRAPHLSILYSVETAVGHPGSPFPALAGLDLPMALDGLNGLHDDEITDVLSRQLLDTHPLLRQVQERFDEHLLKTYGDNPLLRKAGLTERLDRLKDQPYLQMELTARFPGWHSGTPVDAKGSPDEVAYYLDLRARYTAQVVETLGFGGGRLKLNDDGQ